jgi:hypothetical protein
MMVRLFLALCGLAMVPAAALPRIRKTNEGGPATLPGDRRGRNLRVPESREKKARLQAAYRPTGTNLIDEEAILKLLQDDEEMSAPPTRVPIATKAPSPPPTAPPTRMPVTSPIASPTPSPTALPTPSPTQEPDEPTMTPTYFPTPNPTDEPTANPTAGPTPRPTRKPTEAPSMTPTLSPTYSPTLAPTELATEEPTLKCNLSGEARSVRMKAALRSVSSASDLETSGTPQNRAISWLLTQDTRYLCHDDEYLIQRYILAVFYFSTRGIRWIECTAPLDFDSQEEIDASNENCFIEPFPGSGSDAWLTPSSECLWGGVVCNGLDSGEVNRLDMGT